MGVMTDENIRQKMEEALDEPKVSEEFVEIMVVRANAITIGKKAEKLLSEGNFVPDEKADLAAESVVGRMMFTNKPPKGVSAASMALQLASVPEFRNEVEKSGDELIHELKNGDFIKKFGQNAPSVSKTPLQNERDPAKTLPDEPAIKPPTVNSPGLSI